VTQSWTLSVDWNQLQPPASPSNTSPESGAADQGKKPKAKKSGEAQDNGDLDEEVPAKQPASKAQPAQQAEPQKKKPKATSDDEPEQDEGEPAQQAD